MSTALSMETVLAPLDAVRRRVLELGVRLGGRFFLDREHRVAVLGATVILGALATTALVPLWALALGPLILGVPHLVADVRYLWLRPGYHKDRLRTLAIGGPILAGALTGHLVFAPIAMIGALAVARTSLARRVAGLAVALALVALTLVHRRPSELVFVHAHNLVAVAFFGLWRPRASRWHWVPLVGFVVAALALLAGACDPLLDFVAAQAVPRGGGLRRHLHELAPFAGPTFGPRLVLLFAFAQSVHYGVWLRLVPDEDRPRPGVRSFTSSWRALVADCGRPLLVVAVLGAVALAVAAVVELARARAGYLRLAVFHGQLEVAILALWWAEGRLRGGAPAPGGAA